MRFSNSTPDSIAPRTSSLAPNTPENLEKLKKEAEKDGMPSVIATQGKDLLLLSGPAKTESRAARVSAEEGISKGDTLQVGGAEARPAEPGVLEQRHLAESRAQRERGRDHDCVADDPAPAFVHVFHLTVLSGWTIRKKAATEKSAHGKKRTAGRNAGKEKADQDSPDGAASRRRRADRPANPGPRSGQSPRLQLVIKFVSEVLHLTMISSGTQVTKTTLSRRKAAVLPGPGAVRLKGAPS